MKNIFDKGFYNENKLKKLGFKKIGKNVKISKDCLIVGLENISILDNVRIDSFTSIICTTGFLKIGNRVHIGSHGHILCSGGINIGDNCTISQGVKIYSQTDDFSSGKKHGIFLKNKSKYYSKGKITLGNFVLVGSNSIILPSVNIASETSIGAQSLVKKNIKIKGLYAGIPCKKIKPIKNN